MPCEKMYKLGSLFDGSGGFPLTAVLCGIEPSWAAEVEPYPIAVTRCRFPNMKHYGDVSKISGYDMEPVDVISFGSPCQDLSVAGKRAGLKHTENGDEETTRSGLFMEAVRIIKEMREKTNGIYPRFAVWENVPGAFSSNKGEDFRIVCEELIKIVEPYATMPDVPKKGWAYADSFRGDGWSLAYRVLDAQYWGVPQRRRRIYLVADFRDECAQQILFERQGVRGYFTEGGTPWQGITANAQRGTVADDREGKSYGVPLGFRPENVRVYDETATTICNGTRPGFTTGVIVREEKSTTPVALAPVSSTLRAGAGAPKHEQDFVGRLVLEVQGVDPYNSALTGDKAATLGVNCGLATGRNAVLSFHLLQDPIVGEKATPCITAGNSANGQASIGCCYQEPKTFDARGNGDGKTANTLTGDHNNRITDYTSVVVESAGFKPNQGAKAQGIGYELEKSPTLLAGQEPGVCICVADHPTPKVDTKGTSFTLNSRDYKAPLCVVEKQPTICLQGNGIDRADTAGCNGIDRADTAGCNGKGWKEDVCYTLNTIDRPAVAYACEDKVGALCARDYKGVGSQYVDEGKVVAFAQNQRDEVRILGDKVRILGDKVGALQAQPGMKQQSYIMQPPHYIVRRLTPTECARLQGFADRWGDIEHKDELTDEEYNFWLNVRNTHAAINGRAVKEYTRKSMLTWYNKLHTDSSEYKMWGNGIALPTALYVMQGIQDALVRDC